VIGDDVRDLQAAEAAGSPGWLVTENVTLLDVTRELLEHTHTQGRILTR
jgi:hypothetical protein